MDELGDDLLLLAARADGRLPIGTKLRFGLAGSELVRLAAARRVDVVRGRIEIIDTAPTGDALLDDALASMTGGRRGGPTAKAWVAHDRRGLVERYLDRAEAAGIIRAERRKALGFIPVTRWTVVDSGRAAQARARLEVVAASTGTVDSAQAALAGLASAIDVTGIVFPGLAGSAARKRLRQVAKGDAASADATRAVRDAASDDAARAVSDATRAATAAATEAAIRAATDAAVQASVDAATQAAISAATDAATHAARPQRRARRRRGRSPLTAAADSQRQQAAAAAAPRAGGYRRTRLSSPGGSGAAGSCPGNGGDLHGIAGEQAPATFAQRGRAVRRQGRHVVARRADAEREPLPPLVEAG